jgi:hypothetical protein
MGSSWASFARRREIRDTASYWPAEIRVLSPLGDGERQTLLHEMSHAALWFAGFHAERHGPRFVAELERLHGLGEAWALEQAARYRVADAAGAGYAADP